MGALPKEECFFTYADYKEWELDEGERFEIIYGEAYAMAAPNARHQEILGGLFNQFYNYLQDKPCKVYPAPYDVRLFYKEDESDDTVVQPDITVVCDEKKRGHEGCRGAPDLVIEILSPSNTAIEMERKLKLYQEAGVREYWIVDPENNGVTVYRLQERIDNAPNEESSKEGMFALVKPEDKVILTYTYKSADTIPVAVFPDLNITLEQVFAD
jgi:Uma2 family endonuclease